MKHLLENWSRDRVPYRIGLSVLGIFYLALVIFFSPDQLMHDEPRYFQGAHNLARGFFVPESHPDFTNGPGYPLLLSPVTALLRFDFDMLVESPEDFEFYLPDGEGGFAAHLKGRLLPLRLLNVLFLTAGLFVIYRLARQFLSNRAAFLVMIVAGLNPFQLRWVPYMMTENVTPLFFGSFALCWIRALRAERFSIGWTLLAGFCFACLAMIRTLFGYVAATGLIFVPIALLLLGRREMIGRAVSPLAAALVFCLPYLTYTHHHTGRWFCWATNGPELLYWITSPHEGEFGSWLQAKWVSQDPLLAENHLEILLQIRALPVEERGELWMAGVRRHLETDGIGKALARNYTANLTRLFFNAPRSRTFQNFPKLVWILTGSVWVLLGSFAALATVFRRPQVPLELRLLLLLAAIYAGGLLILPAEPRYLIPVAPAIGVWIGFAVTRLVRIRLDFSVGCNSSGPGRGCGTYDVAAG